MGGIGLIYIVLRGQFLNLGGIRYIICPKRCVSVLEMYIQNTIFLKPAPMRRQSGAILVSGDEEYT
jgi:hypothetical protein